MRFRSCTARPIKNKRAKNNKNNSNNNNNNNNNNHNNVKFIKENVQEGKIARDQTRSIIKKNTHSHKTDIKEKRKTNKNKNIKKTKKTTKKIQGWTSI